MPVLVILISTIVLYVWVMVATWPWLPLHRLFASAATRQHWKGVSGGGCLSRHPGHGITPMEGAFVAMSVCRPANGTIGTFVLLEASLPGSPDLSSRTCMCLYLLAPCFPSHAVLGAFPHATAVAALLYHIRHYIDACIYIVQCRDHPLPHGLCAMGICSCPVPSQRMS